MVVKAVADRLSLARRRQFVGRADERELFRSVITAEELPYFVLHIFGPGGVGKTTLLREFAFLCDENRVTATYLDGRNVEPSPEFFVDALQRAMGLKPTESVMETLADRAGRHVILIDTSEMLAPLDGWLREVFLPQLPGNILFVLAGRNPPPLAWRTDPGWQSLIRIIPLRNLGQAEGRAYLSKRAIPAEQHEVVLNFTHGHPLALSLVADVFAQRGQVRFEPEAAPDIIKTLLEQFVQKVPSPAHRAALEACALVRLTTEPLLARMLQFPDAHELFEWLRGLSFIESERRGLFPHDLAREAVAADVRWRNPVWYGELHQRAREFYMGQLRQTPGPDQHRVLSDYIFLHRDNPVVRPYFEWQASGSVFADTVHPGDKGALVAMVREHEGTEAAELAACWLERQPERVVVFRDAAQLPRGLLTLISLRQASAADIDSDPATQAAWAYLQSQAPLRPGEEATYFRFWMAHDTYQSVSPVQSRIFIYMVQHYLTTPGLAFTFIPCATPEFWTPMFAYADLARLPEADFEVGGRPYGVYGHDWRVTPPMAWLALMGERELAAGTPAAVARPAGGPPVLVLSEADFAEAVMEVLREYTQPDMLTNNPLLRSRLVSEKAGAASGTAERVMALQNCIQNAAERLQQSPRQAKFYRALYHTYLKPAPTQEKAAELLDLPFSTFRRHLKAGITRLTEILWQQETGSLEN
jgi:hypothetical protein